MQLIHAFFLPTSQSADRRGVFTAVSTGAIKALLIPIPTVAVVFAIAAVWLKP